MHTSKGSILHRLANDRTQSWSRLQTGALRPSACEFDPDVPRNRGPRGALRAALLLVCWSCCLQISEASLARGSSALVRQIELLKDENQQLQDSVAALETRLRALSAEAIEENERKLELEERIASDKRRAAEAALEEQRAKVEAEEARVAALHAEREVLLARANASLAEIRAAELATTELRAQEKLALAERARGEEEARRADKALALLEKEHEVELARALAHRAAEEAMRSNITLVRAEAEAAREQLRVAEEHRRLAEAEAEAQRETARAAEAARDQATIERDVLRLRAEQAARDARTTAEASEAWGGHVKGLQAEIQRAVSLLANQVMTEDDEKDAPLSMSDVTMQLEQSILPRVRSLLDQQSAQVQELFVAASARAASTSAERVAGNTTAELARLLGTAHAKEAVAHVERLAREAEAAELRRTALVEQRRWAEANATIELGRRLHAEAEARAAEAAVDAQRLALELASRKLQSAEADAQRRASELAAAEARERELATREAARRAELEAVLAAERQARELVQLETAKAAASRVAAEEERARAERLGQEADILEREEAVLVARAAAATARRDELDRELAVAKERVAAAQRELEAASALRDAAIAGQAWAAANATAAVATESASRERRREAEVEREREALALEAASERLRAEEARAAAAVQELAREVAREAAERARNETERALLAARLAGEAALRAEDRVETDRLARARDAERAERELAAQQALELARRDTELLLVSTRAGSERDAAKLKAEAEAEGRIRQERANEDIAQRRLAAEAAAEKERWLAVVDATFRWAAYTLAATTWEHLVVALGTVLALVLGFFLARGLVQLGLEELQRRVNDQPVLVRESSRSAGLWAALTARCRGRSPNAALALTPAAALEGVALASELRAQVLTLALASQNARRNGAPLQHVMFYGPPGTGKTLVAQRLARLCGLDYAIMSGGDVAPLGAQAVSEFHRLFEWAHRSPRGLLLFIDEAEVFLGARGRTQASDHTRNVLSALLHHTGTQTDAFMLVLATNRPEDLDTAVTDRIDRFLYFPLPAAEQRRQMLWRCLDDAILGRAHADERARLLKDAKVELEPRRAGARPSLPCCPRAAGPVPIRVAPGVSAAVVDECVAASEGFSGRQVAKMALNLQAAVYGQEEPVLTPALVRAVLAQEAEKLRQREKTVELDRARARADAATTRARGAEAGSDPHWF